MSKAEILNQFFEWNPKLDREDYNWRADGRLEWVCPHGVGHTAYSPTGNFVHGCCGENCCKAIQTIATEDERKDEIPMEA